MAKSIETVSIGFKLDGKNFPIWSKLMLVAVGSREKLDHLEGDAIPPKSDDPKFKEWQAADYTVFSWLIQNMEPRLVMQFAQHQTAKAKWKSLVTTFGVRADRVQIYDLEMTTIKTTASVEKSSSLGMIQQQKKLLASSNKKKGVPRFGNHRSHRPPNQGKPELGPALELGSDSHHHLLRTDHQPHHTPAISSHHSHTVTPKIVHQKSTNQSFTAHTVV